MQQPNALILFRDQDKALPGADISLFDADREMWYCESCSTGITPIYVFKLGKLTPVCESCFLDDTPDEDLGGTADVVKVS